MIINSNIIELDIEHASPSIWLSMGKITQEEYDNLINLDKHTRVVKTGIMRRDNADLTDALYKGYDIYINKLVTANNLDKEDILYRVHDAIWLIDNIPDVLTFDNVTFAVKHIFNMYFKYNNMEFYIEDITNKLHTRGVRHLSNSPLLDLVKEILINYRQNDKDICYKLLHKAKKNLEKNPEAMGDSIGNDPNFNLKLIKRMIIEFT